MMEWRAADITESYAHFGYLFILVAIAISAELIESMLTNLVVHYILKILYMLI